MKRVMKSLTQVSMVLLLVLGWVFIAQAEQKKVLGDYEVHYIGLTTHFLSKEVAKQYGIKRSSSLGYVSISVLKSGQDLAQDAKVSGTMANLFGQYKNLKFKRVKEGRAIYFISTFPFDKRENYQFAIDIMPADSGQELTLEFKQKFYEES